MNSTAKTAAIIAATIAATVGGLSAADAANPRGPIPAPPAQLDQPPAQVQPTKASTDQFYTLAEVKAALRRATPCQRAAFFSTHELPVNQQRIFTSDDSISVCLTDTKMLTRYKGKEAVTYVNKSYDSSVAFIYLIQQKLPYQAPVRKLWQDMTRKPQQ